MGWQVKADVSSALGLLGKLEPSMVRRAPPSLWSLFQGRELVCVVAVQLPQVGAEVS